MIKNILKKAIKASRLIPKKHFSNQLHDAETTALENEAMSWENFGITQLHRHHHHIFDNLDFEEEIKPNLENLEEKGFDQKDISNIYRSFPEFIVAEKIGEECNNIENIQNLLLEKYGLDKDTGLQVIAQFPAVLRFDNEKILEKIQFVKNFFQFENDTILKLFSQLPKLLFLKEKRLRDLESVFDDYLGYSTEEFKSLIKEYPTLLSVIPSNLGDLVLVLTNNASISRENLQSMIETFPGYLFAKPGNAINIILYLKSLQENSENILKSLIEEPRILALDFSTLFMPKINLLKKHGFSIKEIAEWITYHPSAFIKSLASTDIKLRYLLRRVRMDVNIDKHVPALLNYNYGTFIRARGELLLKYAQKSKQGYDWEKIMKMKDEDFCEDLGCQLSELRELQTALPYSNEYDNFHRIKIGLEEGVIN